MNFQWTPGGSGRERKARREDSWVGPSMDLWGELGGRGNSGER